MAKKAIFTFLMVLYLISCNSKISIEYYDPESEKALIYEILMQEELVTGILDIEQISILRNYIYTHVISEAYAPSLPISANEFVIFITGQRGAYCQGKSILLLAALEAVGFEAREVGMYSGYYDSNGFEYSHAINEVYLEETWHIQDATYNVMFTQNSIPLDIAHLREAYLNQEQFIIESNGYPSREINDGFDYCYYVCGTIRIDCESAFEGWNHH